MLYFGILSCLWYTTDQETKRAYLDGKERVDRASYLLVLWQVISSEAWVQHFLFPHFHLNIKVKRKEQKMLRNLKVNAYIELSTRWLSLKELSFVILKIAEICARLLTRMGHHALLLTFGILGNLASAITFLSPLSTFVKIYKGKSVLEYRPLPYIISLVSQMFWLYYGCLLIQGKVFIVLVSVIGCVSQTAYIAIYVFYATVDLRRRVLWLIASIDVGVFSAVFFPSYFASASVEYRDFFVGSSCVLSSIALFASPLTTVWQVIQSGSVEFMPLPLSVSLVLNAGCWMAYGLVTHNIYILIPNGLGILLGVAQVMVYLYYRYL